MGILRFHEGWLDGREKDFARSFAKLLDDAQHRY